MKYQQDFQEARLKEAHTKIYIDYGEKEITQMRFFLLNSLDQTKKLLKSEFMIEYCCGKWSILIFNTINASQQYTATQV